MSAPPSTIRVALFDWDGTLVDTGDLLLSCWHAATEQVLGYRFPVEEEDRRRVLAMRAVESFPTITSGPEQTAELAATFDGVYEPLAPEHVRAHPGAAELLGYLRDQGIKIGVVTSKTSFRRGIDGSASGLDEFFDLIITGDDVQRGKPDPEGIHTAMSRLGGTVEDTIYVGDGPVDARAGRAAGVWTACITLGLHSAEEFAGVEPELIAADLVEVENTLRHQANSPNSHREVPPPT